MKGSAEYRDLINILKTEYKPEEDQIHLDNFIGRFISKYLDSDEISEQEINILIEIYLRGLKNQPLNAGATVQLVGIILIRIPSKYLMK